MKGADFKRFMYEQNIKQKEVAGYLGLSKGYVSLVISGQRPLSEENLRKLINNPFGWDTSILEGKEDEESRESQPQNTMVEKPEERMMIDRLFSLLESQKKDIETLIQLTKEKDERINELTDELLMYKGSKGGNAASADSSSVADAI